MSNLEKYLAGVKARAAAATPNNDLSTADFVRATTDFYVHARTDVDRLVVMVETAREGLYRAADSDNDYAHDALAELDRLAGEAET